MNALQIPVKTMSSIEIAVLVESRHDSVKRTIERLIKSGAISNTPLVDGIKRGNGVTSQHYSINKRDSYVIVAQLSPVFTAKLVDRWQELEDSRSSQLSIPQSFAEALQLAANQAKQIEEAAPKLEVYELLAARVKDVNTTDLAKQLGVSAKKLNIFLKSKRIKFLHEDYPQAHCSNWFNVIPIVSNGHESNQCLITPLGQIEITKRWNKANKEVTHG